MKIYTKTGDNLKTDSIGSRVYKDHIVIEINGEIDELQATLMLAYHFCENVEIKPLLLSLCKDLFKVGYEISSKKNVIDADEVNRIEKEIDKYQESLPPIKEFILPGYSKGASFVHLARTKARSVERLIVHYTKENSINAELLKYINRISDLLFVLARVEDNCCV